MGREIRRVPKWWKHPTYGDLNIYHQYPELEHPLNDSNYDDAAKLWIEGFLLWQKGEHPHQSDNYFWDGWGTPPESEYYRIGKWIFTSEESTHYQVYETVSEGTPVSPVFETKEEIVQWCITKGHSYESATIFVEHQFCLTGVLENGVMLMGIDSSIV